jgi:hypothetical protein
MRKSTRLPTRIEAEYEDAWLGDARLNGRLVRIATGLSGEPAASFPEAAANDAELEATYRFLGNDRVTPDEILAPHVRQTVRRVHESADAVVVAHDTTEFNFGRSAREDLGRVGQGKSHGFYGHFALAVRLGQVREALGVLGLVTHCRDGSKGRRGHRKLQTDPDNESHRWFTLAEIAEAHLGPGRAIHVMDREADSYGLMWRLGQARMRFVIRMASQKRQVIGETEGTVGEVLRHAEIIAEREVPVSVRQRSSMPAYRKRYPPRPGRRARLRISAATVTLVRPASSSHCPDRHLTLQVVRVFEPKPPAGQEPIEWRLWTLEPIDTVEQVLAIVDAYRCRWVIEEYFKALKTGCAIEKRQLESMHALLNALALLAPIAWRLLLLRTWAHQDEKSSARRVLTQRQITCLRAALRHLKRPELPSHPTARDALAGVADLGGHIRNNGDPGWQVLGRGLDKLLTIELGFALATDGGREM